MVTINVLRLTTPVALLCLSPCLPVVGRMFWGFGVGPREKLQKHTPGGPCLVPKYEEQLALFLLVSASLLLAPQSGGHNISKCGTNWMERNQSFRRICSAINPPLLYENFYARLFLLLVESIDGCCNSVNSCTHSITTRPTKFGHLISLVLMGMMMVCGGEVFDV